MLKKIKTFIKKNTRNKNAGWYKHLEKLNDKLWDIRFAEKKKHYGKENPDQGIYIIRRRAGNVGLLSIVIVVLARLKEAEQRGLVPVVDLMNTRNLYLEDEEVGKVNSWEYYFLQPAGISLESAYRSKNVVLGSGEVSEDRPNDTVDLLMNVDGKLDEWKRLFKQYIHIRPELLQKAEEEYRENVSASDKVVGVCCRGAGYRKARIKNHPIQPEVGDLIEKTKEMMKKTGCTKVYLSTEDGDIVKQFEEVFGAQLFVKQRNFFYFDEQGKAIRRDHSKRRKGEDYLLQLLLLSKCDCTVSARCSGAVGAALMSEGYEDAYYFDLGEYC